MLKPDKSAEIKEALTCNLAAMSPTERTHYEALKKRLRAATNDVKDLPDGYAFRFGSDSALLIAAAEFITRERQGGLFYAFMLEVGSNNGPASLRITGLKEAKSFIRNALT